MNKIFIFCSLVLLCTFTCNAEVANQIEEKQKIWTIKKEYPGTKNRTEAIQLKYGKEDMRQVLQLALNLKKGESEDLLNPDGSLNREELRKAITEDPIYFMLSAAIVRYTSNNQNPHPELADLLALMKKYRNTEGQLPPMTDQEETIMKAGLTKIAELKRKDTRETEEWQSKIETKTNANNTELARRATNETQLKTAYDLAKNYDIPPVDPTQVSPETVTFHYPGGVMDHGNEIGAIWLILKWPNELTNNNVGGPNSLNNCLETPKNFNYNCYNGSNPEIKLAYCYMMVKEILRDIQTGYNALLPKPEKKIYTNVGGVDDLPAPSDMRKWPFTMNNGGYHIWLPNCGQTSLYFSAHPENRVDIDSPLFTSLLDPWVEDQHAKGRTQKQMANDLKTLKFNDLAVYL